AAGAALGMVFAMWSADLLVSRLSTDVAHVVLDLGPDWRVFAFTAAVAAATVLLFGIAPAMRASQADPHEALNDRGKSRRQERGGIVSNLVALQVALSLV